VRAILLLWIVVAALGARTAEATGLCENTPLQYEPPRLFSEQEQAFAVPATRAWCEVQGQREVRGKIAFVELRNIDGRVTGIISSARGPDAGRLEQLIGAFEAVAADKLDAALKARGYAPLAAATRGKTRCEVRATSIRTKEWGGGFPVEQAQVDVISGAARLARIEAELIATQRRGDLAARAHALAKRPAIAVWLRLPGCTGPPPGYFGPKDPGICYPDDKIEILILDAKKLPALATCFAATP
jgi:hypothetical protein